MKLARSRVAVIALAGGFFVGAAIAYVQDVLDDRYHGTTEAYTLVNAGFGVRWMNDQLTTSVKATNLGNQDIQQHVFGDVIKRQIVGELRVQF